MTQPTNIEQLKEVVRKQVFIRPSSLQDAEAIWSVAEEALDEIVTSTYLQAVNETLETQALAIEGMKDETKDPCSTVYNMSDWGKKCANEALQQAADHLRAQKTSTDESLTEK